LLSHQLQPVAAAQVEKRLAADPFAGDASGVEITPFRQIAIDPQSLGQNSFVHLFRCHPLWRANGDDAVALNHDICRLAV
jgi:hypothetical protein